MKIILIFLFVAVIVSSSVFACRKNEIQLTKFQERLYSIKFNKFVYDKVPLLKVIDDLREKSKEPDPDKTGVNIIFLDPPSEGEKAPLPLVTINVEVLNLVHFIEILCKLYDLKYVIDENAIVIWHKDAPVDDMVFRIYTMEYELFLGEESKNEPGTIPMEYYFRARGVDFPSGTMALYDTSMNLLFLTNTSENIRKMEDIIQGIADIDPVVMIDTRIVRIDDDEIGKLKMSMIQEKPFVIFDSSKVKWNDIEKVALEVKRYSISSLNRHKAELGFVTEKYLPESWEGDMDKDTEKNVIIIRPPMPQFGKPVEIGTKLSATPIVARDKYTIKTDFELDIQTLDGWTDKKEGNSSAVMPVINTHNYKYNLTTYDGDTIIIGGDIEKKDGKTFHNLIFVRTSLRNGDGTPMRELDDREGDYMYCTPAALTGRRSYSIDEEKKNIAPKPYYDGIVIKQVDFDNTPIDEVVNILSQKIKAQDNSELNIVLSLNNQVKPKVNLKLTQIPLGQLLQYICVETGLKYNMVDWDTIAIGDSFDDEARMEIRYFRMNNDIFGRIINGTDTVSSSTAYSDIELKSYFSKRGIPFPEGSSITYDRYANMIHVKNTYENNVKFEYLLDKTNILMPQVMLESTIVEIGEPQLLEARKDAKTTAEYLDRLKKSNDSKILYSTRALVPNAEEALLFKGDKVMLPEGWSFPQIMVQENGIYQVKDAMPEEEQTNIGLTFKARPIVSSNKYSIYLELQNELTQLSGWTGYDIRQAFRTSKGAEDFGQKIRMPEISRFKMTTGLKIYDEETVLIGHMQSKEPKPEQSFWTDNFIVNLFKSSSSSENESRYVLIFLSSQLMTPDGIPLRVQEERDWKRKQEELKKAEEAKVKDKKDNPEEKK